MQHILDICKSSLLFWKTRFIQTLTAGIATVSDVLWLMLFVCFQDLIGMDKSEQASETQQPGETYQPNDYLKQVNVFD